MGAVVSRGSEVAVKAHIYAYMHNEERTVTILLQVKYSMVDRCTATSELPSTRLFWDSLALHI